MKQWFYDGVRQVHEPMPRGKVWAWRLIVLLAVLAAIGLLMLNNGVLK